VNHLFAITRGDHVVGLPPSHGFSLFTHGSSRKHRLSHLLWVSLSFTELPAVNQLHKSSLFEAEGDEIYFPRRTVLLAWKDSVTSRDEYEE
jgi:hypothetical protein